ncbi:hypothetical protein Tco_0885332, partial [Tanacetum coccineum]
NPMAPNCIAAISHDEKEELRKRESNAHQNCSTQNISPTSIKELNKNPSAPKRVHFVNSIVILGTDSDTKEEGISSNNEHEHELDDMIRRSKEAKEKDKEGGKTKTDMVVEVVIKEEENEFETNEEVKEIFEEEEEDEDDEGFNLFPTMKELSHHEWLLKHPRPLRRDSHFRARQWENHVQNALHHGDIQADTSNGI